MDPIRNSVSTLEATRTCKTQPNSLRKGSPYRTSVSTPHRRYGHNCGCRFLRTPFSRFLFNNWLDLFWFCAMGFNLLNHEQQNPLENPVNSVTNPSPTHPTSSTVFVATVFLVQIEAQISPRLRHTWCKCHLELHFSCCKYVCKLHLDLHQVSCKCRFPHTIVCPPNRNRIHARVSKSLPGQKKRKTKNPRPTTPQNPRPTTPNALPPQKPSTRKNKHPGHDVCPPPWKWSTTESVVLFQAKNIYSEIEESLPPKQRKHLLEPKKTPQENTQPTKNRHRNHVFSERYKAHCGRAEKVNSGKIWLSPSDPICRWPHVPSADTWNMACQEIAHGRETEIQLPEQLVVILALPICVLSFPERAKNWYKLHLIGITSCTCHGAKCGGYNRVDLSFYARTIVKPLWQLPPSEAKKPSNISRTKNVALKLPKISLTKGYFGQFKGYIFAFLGHFCFLLCLGGCGSQGLYNRSEFYVFPCFAVFGSQDTQMLGKQHEKCRRHIAFSVPQMLLETRTWQQHPHMPAGKARGKWQIDPFLPICWCKIHQHVHQNR